MRHGFVENVMAGRVASRGTDQFMVRFPDGLRDRLRAEAEQAGRSMNSEIVERLDRSFYVNTERDFLTAMAEGKFIEPLPPGLAGRIQAQAEQRGQSVQEEVVQALEAAFPPTMRIVDFISRYIEPLGREADPEKLRQMIQEARAIVAMNGWPMTIERPK